jgi:3',5'-cyclic AMP phosphodiesterase CpdA
MADQTLLFHISDIHFGLEDDRALDWVMQEIAEKRPAAVAITGDLTMRARHREFDAATRWIRNLDVPVTVEVGNHDLPYFNLIERFTTPYKRFRGMLDLINREIDLPGLAIVPLKTVRRWQPRWPWSHGWVTDKALQRTLAALDALPAGTRALVTCHHPLVEAGRRQCAGPTRQARRPRHA